MKDLHHAIRSSRPAAGVLTAAALGALSSLTGCWGGTVGLIAAGSGGGGGGQEQVIATALSLDTPTDGQSGRVALNMNVQFDPSHTVVLQAVRFSLAGGDQGYQDVTPAQGFPTEVLPVAGGSAGSANVFPVKGSPGTIQKYRMDWNSHFDVDGLKRLGAINRPSTARAELRVTILNQSSGQSFTATTGEFFLDQSLVRTVAGGGVGDGIVPAFASMLDPVGVALDMDGNVIIADSGNNRLRRITVDTADPTAATAIDTLIGNGFAGIANGFQPALKTGMATPLAAVATGAGNVFTAENDPSQTDAARQGVIRYLDRSSALITNAIVTLVTTPQDVDLETTGLGPTTLFVSDTGLGGVRAFDIVGIDPVTDDIEEFTDFTGTVVDTDDDGTADAPFSSVAGIAFATDGAGGRSLFVADLGATPQVHELDLATGVAVPVAGGGAVDPSTDPDMAIDGPASALMLSEPRAVAASPFFLFLADKALDVVVVVDRADGTVVNVLAGFVQPAGVEITSGTLYVCEASDGSFDAAKNAHRVTVVTDFATAGNEVFRPLVAGGSVKVQSQTLDGLTVQGTDFDGTDETGGSCGGSGSTTATEGDPFTVQDSVAARGQATGQKAAATEAPLARPEDVALDRDRGVYYVTDTGNRLICKVIEQSGQMVGVAGSLSSTTDVDETDRDARSVRFDRPTALEVTRDGSALYIANSSDSVPGGNVVRVSLGTIADEGDNTARVILPNRMVDADSPLRSPVAVATASLGNQTFLFVGDNGDPLDLTPPAIHMVDVALLEDGVDAAEVITLSATELLQVCRDDFPDGSKDRSAALVYRFIRDLYPVQNADGSFTLLVGADLDDNLLEAFGLGDAAFTSAVNDFEDDCYNGVDDDGDGFTDFDDSDCTAPMRSAILAYDFDASGNFQDIQILVYGFKRFLVNLDPADVDCSCGSPTVGSIVDDPDLVVERIAADDDLNFVYATDPCRNQVRFYEIDRSLLFPVIRFGTAVGSDFQNADPFDGSPPLDTALGRPRGIDVNDLDDLYMSDTLNNRIRRSWVGDQIRFR